MTTKDFPLGAILSVTTGRLLIQPFSEVHEFIEYLAGEPVWTHQLGRVAQEAKPIILSRHPQLSEIDCSDIDQDNWETRIRDLEAAYGKTLPIEPMNQESHESIDPLSELIEMVPPSKIIAVHK